MRKILLSFILSGLTLVAFSQQVEVVSTQKLPETIGKAYHPTISPRDIPIPPMYPDPSTQEKGAVALDQYSFTSLKEDNPAWLGASKKILINGSFLYSLDDDGTISVINPTTFAVTGSISATESGTTYPISDFAFTGDNKLIAITKASIVGGGTQTMKVYRWSSNDAIAEKLFESDYCGDLTTATLGDVMTVVGGSWNFKLYATAKPTSGDIRLISYHFKENDPIVTNYMRTSLQGSKITMVPSPFDDSQLTIDSEMMYPTDYKFDWAATPGSNITAINSLASSETSHEVYGATYFKYAGRMYMALSICDAGGTNVRVKLLDVTGGLNTPITISTIYPESGLGNTPASFMTAVGAVSGYDIFLTVAARNQGIARFKSVEQSVYANIYASSLRTTINSWGQTEISYVLNENATAVNIELLQGDVLISSFPSTGLSKGRNTVTIDLSSITSGSYRWQVKATAPTVGRPLKFTSDENPLMQYFAPFGLAIDNNFNSPYFGRIYIGETLGGAVTSGTQPNRTTTNGVFVLDPLFADITNQGSTGYNGGVANWSHTSTSMKMVVAPDNRLFIANSSVTNSGVYIMNPTYPTDNFTPVFQGTRNTDGLISEGGVTIAGPSTSCWVLGQGENTKLYTLDRLYVTPTANNIGNLVEYDISNKPLPLAEVPAIVYNDALNGNKQQNWNSTIVSDGRGGWWISQYRASEAIGIPSLIHVNTSGMIDFNSAATNLIVNSQNGALALSNDGKRIAVGSANAIKVFSVEYDIDNIPSLAPLHVISPALGANSNSLAFDVADNLYLVSNSGERLGAWSLPKTANSFTTPSPAGVEIVKAINPASSLLASVVGSGVQLTWNRPTGGIPTGYKVYRGGVFIATVSHNTFTESVSAIGSYTYEVSVMYGAEESTKISVVATVSSVGNLPVTDLQANVTENLIGLTWNPASGATPTGYKIYRDGTLITTVTGAAYSEQLPSLGIYRYEVAALYGSFESVKSLVYANVYNLGHQAVNNLQSSIFHNQVTLTWHVPIGSIPDGYTIYRNGIAISSVTTTTFNETVSAHGTYTYEVAARYGDSESTKKSKLVTISSLGVQPVLNLQSAVVDNHASLTWNAPVGSIPSGYKVYRDGAFIAMVATTSFDEYSTLLGSFNYEISAMYGTDESTKKSNQVIVTHLGDYPVINLQSTVVDYEVALTWQPQAGTTPSGYKIYRDDVVIQTVGETTFTDRLLNKGTYKYSVSALYLQTIESAKVDVNATVNVSGATEKPFVARAYPNPTSDLLIIETKDEPIQTIKIYTLSGKIVLNQVIEGASIYYKELEMKNYNNGVYLLKVNENTTIKVLKK